MDLPTASNSDFWTSVYQECFPRLTEAEKRNLIEECVLRLFVSEYIHETYVAKSGKKADDVVKALTDAYLEPKAILASPTLVPKAIQRMSETLLKKGVDPYRVNEYVHTVLLPRWYKAQTTMYYTTDTWIGEAIVYILVLFTIVLSVLVLSGLM